MLRTPSLRDTSRDSNLLRKNIYQNRVLILNYIKMFKLSSLITLLLISIYAGAQPKIEFESLEHLFGKIQEDGGKVEATFTFKNVGDKPLILYTVSASCGCTTPKWNKQPIAPGGSDQIKVVYNPMNRPGTFRKNVIIKSNAQANTSKLTIKGSVIPRIKSDKETYPHKIGELNGKSKHASMGKIYNRPDATYSKTIEFKNLSEKSITVSDIKTPEHITATLSSREIKPQEIGSIEFIITPSLMECYGFNSEVIPIKVTGEEKVDVDLTVSYNIAEDFSKLTTEEKGVAPRVSLNKTLLNLGDIKKGESVNGSIKLRNRGASDMIVRSLKAASVAIEVKSSSQNIPAGESADIDITFTASKRKGRQNKSITLITNDPLKPVTIIRVIGNIVD